MNEALWTQIQLELSDYLSRFKTCATYLWSKQKNDYVKVGATFNSYEFGGNTLTFQVDRTFSREFGNKGFGMLIDLSADKVSGTPAIQCMTLKNGDIITNRFIGVGGEDGLSSGFVSSAVAASKLIIHGYSGVMVASPYRAAIIKQI